MLFGDKQVHMER